MVWRQGVLVPARKQQQKISDFSFLEQRDISFLRICVPALLSFRKWELESFSSYLTRLDGTVTLMEPFVRNELRQLFDLFHFVPIKWWLGLGEWERVSEETLLHALTKLQNSRVSDLRAASLGLNELINSIYYSDPNNYHELNYAAPVELL